MCLLLRNKSRLSVPLNIKKEYFINIDCCYKIAYKLQAPLIEWSLQYNPQITIALCLTLLHLTLHPRQLLLQHLHILAYLLLTHLSIYLRSADASMSQQLANGFNGHILLQQNCCGKRVARHVGGEVLFNTTQLGYLSDSHCNTGWC